MCVGVEGDYMKKYARMPRKKCSRCQLEKPLNQFYNNKRTKDGKSYTCKECCVVKPLYHGKSTKKKCLKCLKIFRSYGGARLCPPCVRSNNNIGELYITGNITYHRKGAIS